MCLRHSSQVFCSPIAQQPEEVLPDEVQERQDRQLQEVCPGQEEQVDRRRHQGPQGAGCEGFRCYQEGQRPVFTVLASK